MLKHSYLPFLFIFSIMFSCADLNTQSKATILTYDLKLEITSDTLPEPFSDYLFQKFGDRLRMTFDSLGNIRMDYFGSGDYGYDYQIYDHASNQLYGKWKNLDTLYYYGVSENILELTSKNQLRDSVINGVKCRAIQYNAVHKTNPNDRANQTFFYRPDTLRIDYKKLLQHKEFFYSDYLDHARVMYLKKITEMSGYSLTYTLTAHNENVWVNSDLFSIPNHLPQKEF